VKWRFSYKKIKIKNILICESYHKLNPTYTSESQKLSEPFTAHYANSNAVFDQWVPNVSEIPSGVLIIDFVRWLCGPWAAFNHWRTYLSTTNCVSHVISVRRLWNCRILAIEMYTKRREGEKCWKHFYVFGK
jgi:hypothetical protein